MITWILLYLLINTLLILAFVLWKTEELSSIKEILMFTMLIFIGFFWLIYYFGNVIWHTRNHH